MKKNEHVVLVHGFCRSQTDMFPLKNALQELGYVVETVDLPTRFSNLADCVSLFADKISKIAENIGNQKIHLVGHSMGGLIIKTFLAQQSSFNLGRCVLIAPPNQGTKLADMLVTLFPMAVKIFKPLECLLTGSHSISSSTAMETEIGVIAGNKNNLFWSSLLAQENDGRVEVESTKFEHMTDFIIKHYNHEEIHHKPDTADAVDMFLQYGFFNKKANF